MARTYRGKREDRPGRVILEGYKRTLSRLVVLPAGRSVRPVRSLPSGVAVLFVGLSESYPPPSREASGVVIYRCRGHPFRDGQKPNRKDPYYYSYHAPLRRIFLKIQMDIPEIPKTLALALANKAMNDTCGPEGIVPSLLVFGAITLMPFGASDLPERKERMQAIALARSEMETVDAKQRIKNALKRKVPPAATTMITPGS